MKQINSNGQTWLFVPVPESTNELDMISDNELAIGHKNQDEDYDDFVTSYYDIPPGEWSIHCHSTKVTEEQAAQIVTNEGTVEQPCYTDYNDPLCGHKSAIPSLLSRAQAEGMRPPFVVLKKQ